METGLQKELDKLSPESRDVLMNLFAHWNEDPYHTWKEKDLIHELKHKLDTGDVFFAAFVELMVPLFLDFASRYYDEQKTNDT